MQSIFGALFTAATRLRHAAIAAAPNQADHGRRRGPTHEVLRRRRGDRGAAPAVRERDHGGGQSSFLDGADWAYTAGIVAILLGAVLVFFLFPKREEEERLLAAYQAEDASSG